MIACESLRLPSEFTVLIAGVCVGDSGAEGRRGAVAETPIVIDGVHMSVSVRRGRTVPMRASELFIRMLNFAHTRGMLPTLGDMAREMDIRSGAVAQLEHRLKVGLLLRGKRPSIQVNARLARLGEGPARTAVLIGVCHDQGSPVSFDLGLTAGSVGWARRRIRAVCEHPFQAGMSRLRDELGLLRSEGYLVEMDGRLVLQPGRWTSENLALWQMSRMGLSAYSLAKRDTFEGARS